MSDKKDEKPVGIFGKIKKVILIAIPVLIVVAIAWVVIKYINKKKNGENPSVGETVQEGVNLVSKIFSKAK